MKLQLFVNDNELQAFFEACGYRCRYENGGHFRSAYHNREEWVETRQLVVEHGGKTIPAEKLMEATLKARVLTPDYATGEAVKTAFNQLLKSN